MFNNEDIVICTFVEIMYNFNVYFGIEQYVKTKQNNVLTKQMNQIKKRKRYIIEICCGAHYFIN